MCWKSWLWTSLWVAPTLLTTACGSSETAARWSAVDSAGTTIVSGPPPPLALGLVPSAPLLDVAEADGAPIFRATGVLPRADGSFVVLDSGNQRVLLFDAVGRLLARAGGRGEGPGEFQAPSVLAIDGDSTLVFDARLGRVTVFGAGLEFGRDRLLEGDDTSLRPRFAGAFRGGPWVGVAGVPSSDGPPPNGPFRAPARYLAIEADGLRPLAEGKGSERWVNTQMAGGQVTSVNVISYPFFRNTLATVAGDRLVLGDTDAWVLSVFDAEGRLRRSVRMGRSPEEFGAPGLQRYLDTLTDLSPSERAVRERSFDGVSLPATLPAFSGLLLDDLGRIWAREFNLDPTVAETWIVFSDEGAAGSVVTPAGFKASAVTSTLLYGVYRDEFDVESVRVYALESGASAIKAPGRARSMSSPGRS